MDSPLALSITVGTADVRAAVAGLHARAADLTAPLAAQAVPTLAAYFQRRFATEGAYGGTKWAPLATRTLKARKRRGRGRGGILVDRGDLEQSLVAPGAAGNLREVTASSLVYGTTRPTARYHQSGTRRMPARPLIPAEGLPAAEVDSITAALRAWVLEGRA